MNAATEITTQRAVLCLFLANNKIVLRRNEQGGLKAFSCLKESLDEAEEILGGMVSQQGFEAELKHVGDRNGTSLYFASLELEVLPEGDLVSMPLVDLYRLAEENSQDLDECLFEVLPVLRENVIKLPYLYFSDNDYVYRFRTSRQRNKEIYHIDDTSMTLYHSCLCDAVKALKRARERSATSPALLNFGATHFSLPSHFGFCLGVQNAIERAYETLAANPGKRVFMLSELIHNPFVNEDLQGRGLLYLQSDKGVPQIDPVTGEPYWDTLCEEDVVIIPAFGARNEDKVKLIERGLPLNRYDATCMLVEKVWKAARRYGQQGYTVVIHGKAEHEETKATFSNSSKYAPSLIVRDMKEAAALSLVILADSKEERRRLFEPFANRCTEGFDLERDLQKLAVVNQTTLLRNETLKIIESLQSALVTKFGQAHVEEHMAMSSKGDTLCYATQVNQDALAKASAESVDVAIVVGGKNSSNTYQLYRLCESRFGDRAFYIQSEKNILSKESIEHFVFPYNPTDPKQGRMETRPFIKEEKPLKVLLTGGASCPDGILQRIIAKVNSFYPGSEIREIDEIISELETE
ncbi:4-hydroxy-3-methylbut-2-enyl diphosphate reductase [Puniceicoccaceae bacterium K14]|nr:4-hydroxy-3-methylbut-2-enyl diphosphate reductase [Puniceicoccaceae bacterium K14]